MLPATCTFPFNWLVLTFANGSQSLPSTPCLFSFYNLWHILYTHFLLHLTLLRVFLLSQLLDRFAVLQLASNPTLLTAALSDDIPHVVSVSAQSLSSHISQRLLGFITRLAYKHFCHARGSRIGGDVGRMHCFVECNVL